ncbi:thiamine biosynthesis protein ThiH [Clostridium polyendosporum]|uniref:Thiamine biosynthesis protein ThiH n=1 Tax=Clostridium polyendosporum TaxID=69208 RepID=A0A919S070_9CLOT|nr:2-iminoacetate synthase ThiH [Clostridium polyendosporum]GIM28901.1 thiamine biosynthesis protein ThiH [Clostridium polyendosporum]
MSFYNFIKKFKDFDFDGYFKKVTLEDVRKSIYSDNPTYEDLLNLLSPAAENTLEEMAQRANKLTEQYFGRTILLYTPMYLSNYCSNNCIYCGYGIKNKIHRKKLTDKEIYEEGKSISEMGFKHLLILTGESEYHTPTDYLINSVRILRDHFPSIGIEVNPLSEEDYKTLINEGVDGLTVYQEVYDEEIYDKVHISGGKKDYKFRLDAPERGAKAGMRTVSIGALLGLNKFRSEAFFTGMHGKYLRDKYPDVDITYSTPRIRPFGGEFKDIHDVSDRNLVQVILAYRLLSPNSGINLSTRENGALRENLIPLGVTKLSAGVSVAVGGHSLEEDNAGSTQFEISDDRSVEEIKEMLNNKGYQPIFKDWVRF